MQLFVLCMLLSSIPKEISELNLKIEKPPRQDIMFMKKVKQSSGHFYTSVFQLQLFQCAVLHKCCFLYQYSVTKDRPFILIMSRFMLR